MTFVSPTADIDPRMFHEMVSAEARGEADEVVLQRLELDPWRWAAHLGMVIGEISDQLAAAGPDADPEWHIAALWARRGYIAKKADVVALRKQETLHVQVTRLNDRCRDLVAAMREIRDLIESSLPDADTCAAIHALVQASIVRPPPAEQERVAS